MGSKKDEYLMLREEILHIESLINNTINFFYAFISSFLAFALTRSDTVFLLLSYMITIPAHLIVVSKMEGMCRIGAYLYVFCEGKEFNWETRCILYKHEKNRRHFTFLNSSSFPFGFVNVGVFALFMYRTGWKIEYSTYEIVKISLAIIMFAFMAISVLKNGNISSGDFVYNWEKVKRIESE